MLKKLIPCLILSSSFCFSEELPEPYASIKRLPFDNHGWFLNGDHLKVIIKNRRPKTVIEVGSWLGLSTRFIASHLPKKAKLYAIDTWLGSTEEAVHQQDPRLSHLYQLFLSNVIHAGLCHKIIPIRMTSLEAAKALKVRAELIYIDGAHDTKSVTEDILAWHEHLTEKGIICGDDWVWTTVQVAVIECGKKLNKKVYTAGNFWWYE